MQTTPLPHTHPPYKAKFWNSNYNVLTPLLLFKDWKSVIQTKDTVKSSPPPQPNFADLPPSPNFQIRPFCNIYLRKYFGMRNFIFLSSEIFWNEEL